MKYLIILISVFCLAQYSSAEPLLGELLGGVGGVVHNIIRAATKLVGSALQIVTPAANTCLARYTLTSDEYRRYSTIQPQETRNGNCFMSCMMKKLLVMSSDNEATREGFSTAVLVLYPDAISKQKFADELFESCGHITDPDECEAAAQLSACIFEVAKAQAKNHSKGILGLNILGLGIL